MWLGKSSIQSIWREQTVGKSSDKWWKINDLSWTIKIHVFCALIFWSTFLIWKFDKFWIFENSKQKNLFLNNNLQPNQNNNVNFNNESNLGSFLFEHEYMPKKIIDNNVDEVVRNQFIEEKDIIIDTADRDIDVFPNIFNFTLKLGSTDTTPGPFIHRPVKNVKYLKLVILFEKLRKKEKEEKEQGNK